MKGERTSTVEITPAEDIKNDATKNLGRTAVMVSAN